MTSNQCRYTVESTFCSAGYFESLCQYDRPPLQETVNKANHCDNCERRCHMCGNIGGRIFRITDTAISKGHGRLFHPVGVCNLYKGTSVNKMRRYTVDFFVVALLFNVHGKHLRSCRDGQLT